RDGRRAVLAGLALGVALTVSPLIGGTGMQVAALATLLGALDLGRGFMLPVLALAGASLFALPQVIVALDVHVPPLVLPLAASSGIALLLAIRRRPRDTRLGRRRWRLLSPVVILALPAAVLLSHARRQSEFFNDAWFGYALLLVLAVFGLTVSARDV